MIKHVLNARPSSVPPLQTIALHSDYKLGGLVLDR